MLLKVVIHIALASINLVYNRYSFDIYLAIFNIDRYHLDAYHNYLNNG